MIIWLKMNHWEAEIHTLAMMIFEILTVLEINIVWNIYSITTLFWNFYNIENWNIVWNIYTIATMFWNIYSIETLFKTFTPLQHCFEIFTVFETLFLFLHHSCLAIFLKMNKTFSWINDFSFLYSVLHPMNSWLVLFTF